MADTASIEYKTNSCVLSQSMASRRLKRDLATISKTSIFEAPKFSENFLRIFLPFRSVGFSLRAWLWGRGSRGKTPLHLAAENGQDSVVEQLLEAKAAVDAQNKRGRGLGPKIWGGKTRHRSVVRKVESG